MREIKFRAWDKKFNIMLDPEAFNRNDIWISGEGSIYEIEEWCTFGGGGKVEIDCSEQYVLMQSTGHIDRNGKDIYEGDIVQIQGHPFEGPMQINGNYEVGYNDRMELCCGSLLLHRERHYAEVIGNKFENPSLLEVTNE
ncbi:YopX family protein [Paenibacillus sp. XY044]|uniref:YopX family protein n=1 Tax=Paenibacillus sp. XY044 TaxID=2026089 RepID=UPI000B991C66|nr:YopX family protein [Paenibacillus sp. XY044]OZB90085.1 hypothetical protein CJP46_35500 [Paenibacillus sp. XY044]